MRQQSCTAGKHSELQSFKDVYEAYLEKYWPQAFQEADWFGGTHRVTLADVVEVAARSELPGGNGHRLVVHDHQRRVGRRRLAGLARELVRDLSGIRASSSFPDLLAIVEKRAKSLDRVGSLTAYDVAHRIGRYLSITPDCIYLHAGTKKGAHALGLSGRGGKLAVSELPTPLNRLTPAQAEDVLCIFEPHLRRIAQRAK